MSTFVIALLVLAPFALAAVLALRAHRAGHLRWQTGQFRFAAPMAGRIFGADGWDNDADGRRSQHEIDAIRTRFEQHPAWPRSGALGERR